MKQGERNTQHADRMIRKRRTEGVREADTVREESEGETEDIFDYVGV